MQSEPTKIDWLAAALDYVPRWIEFQMRVFEQPGCAVAVTHRGKVVLETALGVADLQTGEPLTPRHRFRVASHSKTFTAAGIMMLRERGALGLDDRVGTYVPGLHAEVAETRLSQLLSHSAGVVRDGATADQWLGRRPFADEVELSAALSHPPTIEPVSRFKYSNYGYGLLGRVIETVADEPYASWIRREVIDAAGLTETTPDVASPAGAPMASGHSSKLPLGRRVVLDAHRPTQALAAATGFVSTAGDLARFFAQLSPTAESALLRPASRREMTRAQWRNPHSSLELHYGLGTMSGGVGRGWWFGHHGAFQGFMSRTAVLPGLDVTVSIVTNAIDGPAISWVAGALYVLGTFARRGAPAEALQDWAGRWWTIWGATDFTPVGDRVLASNPALPMPFTDASEMEVTGPDAAEISLASGFGSHGEIVERIRDAEGVVREMRYAGTTMVPEERMAAELTAAPPSHPPA